MTTTQLAAAATVPLATAPGQRLRADAAASWDRLARAVERRYGWLPRLTDSYRPYAVQERIFLERYRRSYCEYKPGRVDRRVWNGVAYYRRPGTAAAAVPGTSNHGGGIAVDVTGLGGFGGERYAQLATLAPAYGWTNTEGRRVDEAWHWTYDPDDDEHARARPPAPTPREDDDMSAEAEKKIAQLWDLLMPATKGVREDDGRLAKLIKSTATNANAAHAHARRAADAVTPGEKGVKHDGALYALVKALEDDGAGIDPAVIAAAIPDELAGEVVDELAARLAG